jgi:hypothetical protein
MFLALEGLVFSLMLLLSAIFGGQTSTQITLAPVGSYFGDYFFGAFPAGG